jgi:hypothetical protein
MNDPRIEEYVDDMRNALPQFDIYLAGERDERFVDLFCRGNDGRRFVVSWSDSLGYESRFEPAAFDHDAPRVVIAHSHAYAPFDTDEMLRIATLYGAPLTVDVVTEHADDPLVIAERLDTYCDETYNAIDINYDEPIVLDETTVQNSAAAESLLATIATRIRAELRNNERPQLASTHRDKIRSNPDLWDASWRDHTFLETIPGVRALDIIIHAINNTR